jgi:tetratricopeptide (TPR) repeat protein
MNQIYPSQGGIELFQKIWQTTCGGFKNESQNYSQIAIASLINFDQLVHQYGDTVFLVEGDRLFRDYSRKSHKLYNSYEFLNRCLAAYENDFLDDVIPYDYFMKKITLIRKEYARIAKQIAKSDNEVVLRKYPSSEEHLTLLAYNLTRRQRFEDAISLLKLNLDIYPESTSSLDSIARLYRLTGNKKNADLYSNKAGALVKEGVKNND